MEEGDGKILGFVFVFVSLVMCVIFRMLHSTIQLFHIFGGLLGFVVHVGKKTGFLLFHWFSFIRLHVDSVDIFFTQL